MFFPNERVSDVVKDYQGNYWFSTLDNGVFICSSLDNSLLKIYNDPVLDNFTRLQSLPGGEIVAGNSQGAMAKINLQTGNVLNMMGKAREIEFLTYDSVLKIFFLNRGVFKPNRREPIELIDFSKGVGEINSVTSS
jgi:hypothetical protein